MAVKRLLDARHLKHLVLPLSNGRMKRDWLTRKVSKTFVRGDWLRVRDHAGPAASSVIDAPILKALVLNDESWNFLRVPHNACTPAAVNTVPTLTPGPMTYPLAHFKVEGPGGPLFRPLRGMGWAAQRAGLLNGILDPETQVNFRLPNAGYLGLKKTNLSGQEVRGRVGWELPAGVEAVLRKGGDAAGRLVSGNAFFR